MDSIQFVPGCVQVVQHMDTSCRISTHACTCYVTAGNVFVVLRADAARGDTKRRNAAVA